MNINETELAFTLFDNGHFSEDTCLTILNRVCGYIHRFPTSVLPDASNFFVRRNTLFYLFHENAISDILIHTRNNAALSLLEKNWWIMVYTILDGSSLALFEFMAQVLNHEGLYDVTAIGIIELYVQDLNRIELQQYYAENQ